jgi:HK97 family phage major capsid protein
MGITGWLLSLTTPKGLISGAGNSWAALTIKNHRSCMGALHKAAWKGDGPKWYCSPQYYFDVMMSLADAAGGATQTEIIVSESNGKRRFLGLPVEFAPLPDASASGHIPCVLGNLKRGAMLGDRRKTTIEKSTEALFLERQIAILGTERVDIQVYGCHDVKTDSKTRAGTVVGLKTT